MYKKTLSKITISTELFHIEPIQNYIEYLAQLFHVPDKKLFHLKILIEEVFSHIISKAFDNRSDGEIDITVSVTPANFELRFHYLGIPFGYNLERVNDDQDEISLTLIKQLSTSYKMLQDGKKGQTIEINIGLPSQTIENMSERQPITASSTDLATDNVELREIRNDEMEMLVQCLYQVFGYSYSADSIYFPEVLAERKREGIYTGFVAVNTSGKVVAHVGMLKDAPSDIICECGQAFVSPLYGKRGLFNHLKKKLLEKAETDGLKGVISSAVTGHPFTQKANLNLGCVETGFELGYIPAELHSMIQRKGTEQRQTAVNFFFVTSHGEKQTVYLPKEHCDIIKTTYKMLRISRNIVIPDIMYDKLPEESEVEFLSKIEWNQVHINIKKPGKDLGRRITNIIRQSIVGGTAVFYLSISLADPMTPTIINILESLGFFYSGIIPYKLNGKDSICMQYLSDYKITPEYVCTVSDWANKLKSYVFKCKDNQDKKVITWT